MPKRLLLLSVVAFALVNCGVGTRCFAEATDVSAQFEQADEYEEDGKYKDAEVIYKGIAEAYAGKEDGLRAQQKLVCLYIERGRTAEAETAYQELLAGYAGYGDDNVIADAVDEVADAYRDVKKYDKALEIYSYVVDTWPRSEQAVGSHGGIARVNVALGREEAAQAAIDKLFEGFSDNEDIANAVDGVADEYREVKKYEKALELYKYVVDTWPGSEQAIGSQGCIVRINIELGDDLNAKAAVDELIAKFAGRDDIVEAVRDAANEYRDVKKYEKALELYKHVVDSWPESEEAIESQRCIVRINIELGDDPNAEAAVDELIAKFAGRDDIAEQVHDVANEYQDVERYEKALELYKYVVDNWPGKRQAIWSQMGIVRLYIGLGDDPNAETAVGKLIADFSANSDLPVVLNRIAEIYEGLKKYEESRGFYEQVIQRAPDSLLAKKAQLDIRKADILSLIDFGDDANERAAIDQLIADFNDHPHLVEVIFQVAEKYYSMSNWHKGKGLVNDWMQSLGRARAIWERIALEMPRSDRTVDSYYLAASCCEAMGEHKTAINYYRKVVNEWPDYKYACAAQFLVARCYEKLQRTGAISRTDAGMLIRQSCEQLLVNYADCGLVKAARACLEDWRKIYNEE